MDTRSLQERFAPKGRCFGCGPANELGLRIQSHEAGDGTVVAEWRPRPEHEAFDGYVNGGILGTLIDCHSNWTAVAALMAETAGERGAIDRHLRPDVRFRRPTPSDRTAADHRASDRGGLRPRDRRDDDRGRRGDDRHGPGDVREREAGPPGIRALVGAG